MDPKDATSSQDDGKIVCHIDNARVHSIPSHLRDHHPSWTLERYKAKFPDAPLFSDKALSLLEQAKQEKMKKTEAEVTQTKTVAKKAFLHEVFALGNARAALSSLGQPIEIQVITQTEPEAAPYMATIDPRYVFNIDLLKKVIIGMELRMPVYLWGYHGAGKTTVFEQVAARTGRPFLRVQHTANTEEAHVLGQYVVRNGATLFELGPLPMAMKYGFVYCADEYDFAMPSVTAVYQPVLEGKPLIIKEAPEELRVIHPHPDFRIVATGNTNGVGDETGLYQGTMIQNAANYSRFSITEEVTYMDPKDEAIVLVSQVGIDRPAADKIVDFANKVRKSFAEGKISMTISPRELINAATLGIAMGSDYAMGLKLAFANRCSRVDKEVVHQLSQRIFGN